jgi:hypothetical protein
MKQDGIATPYKTINATRVYEHQVSLCFSSDEHRKAKFTGIHE